MIFLPSLRSVKGRRGGSSAAASGIVAARRLRAWRPRSWDEYPAAAAFGTRSATGRHGRAVTGAVHCPSLLISPGAGRGRLVRCAEVLAERCSVLRTVEESAILKQWDVVVDERVDPVLVYVHGHPEPVDGSGFEPLLNVVGDVSGGADGRRVVVDDAVGEDLADGPSLSGDLEGVECSCIGRFGRAAASSAAVSGVSSRSSVICRPGMKPR